MPLIRYNLGDLAIKLPRSEYPKDSSLQLPLLQKIVGRETDIVYTPNGKGLIVHTFTGIMEHYQEIKQFRVLQTTLDKITIEYNGSEQLKESVNKFYPYICSEVYIYPDQHFQF
jgi:phenylacetate-CoA ligase